jgi:Myosin-like coiled-coil protein
VLTFQQVEDTLNNSNELFLTFRKEMEEMSKKTKRLEKENLTLTRKHDQTNRNILEMAEERTRDKEDLERLRKQEQQMRKIIKTMQEQGRGVPVQDVDDVEGTESEYDEEYDDEEEEEDEDYEEGVEPAEMVKQELAAMKQQEKPFFGPVPPPDLKGKEVVHLPMQQAAAGLVNGVKH